MEQNRTTQYSVRHRVNFAMSVKGIVTPDITVEMIDKTKEEVVKEAGELLVLAQQIAKEKSLSGG